MNPLPINGRIDCARCFRNRVVQFNKSTRTMGDWRIINNPLAWGNQNAEIVILGFSKGPRQAKEINKLSHEEIPFRGSRLQIGQILDFLNLLPIEAEGLYESIVDGLITDENGKFHFGSLVRCTVQQRINGDWSGSGGDMLNFVSIKFGKEIMFNCCNQFFGDIPEQTKLIIIFGFGEKLSYIPEVKKLFEDARGTEFNYLKNNKVAYSDGKITVVHVEHFSKAGGWHLKAWLGQYKNIEPSDKLANAKKERAKLGRMAKKAVKIALNV